MYTVQLRVGTTYCSAKVDSASVSLGMVQLVSPFTLAILANGRRFGYLIVLPSELHWLES